MAVYVLYHPSDVFLAIALATDLKNAGVQVWLDRLEIDDQQDVFDETRKAEQSSSVLLALLSPDLLASGYGRAAIESAHTNHHPIVSVQLHHIPMNAWIGQLDVNRTVQLAQWQDPAQYRAALQDIIAQLRRVGVPQETFVNPEKRYINRLIAKIQTHKALLEQNRYVVSTTHFVPFGFEIEKDWGLNGVFLAYGSLTQEPTQVRNLHRFVSQQGAVVLVGRRGVGKTATVLRLLWEYLQDYRAGNRHIPMPFYVDLRAWENGVTLEAFLARYVDFTTVLDDFKRGRAMAFIDHIEEMAAYSAQRVEAVRAWLFDNKTQPLRAILACHSDVYGVDFAFDLPIVQIEKPLDNAFEKQLPAVMTDEDAALFTALVRESAVWRVHACNATHFGALLWYFLTHHTLPEISPEQLHVQYINMLWQRLQLLKDANWIPFEELMPKLARLAFTRIADALPSALSRAQAVQLLGSAPLLEALGNAAIFLLDRDFYTFAKPLWCEILAAHYLPEVTLYECLSVPQVMGKSWRVGKWDEVLVAYSGLVDDLSSLLTLIAEVNPPLAARCAQGRVVSQRDRNYLAEKLLGYFREHPESVHAVRGSLDVLFDGAPLSPVLAMMRQGSQVLRQTAAMFLVQAIFPKDSLAQQLLNKLEQRSRQTLQLFHHLGEQALLVLLHCLYANDKQSLRAAAAWALGELADAAAVPLLLRALQSPSVDVRYEAVKALGRIGDALSAEPIVYCLQDRQPRIREVATIALARMGAAAVPPLRRMLHAQDETTRRIAIGVLGQVGDASIVEDIQPFLHDENVDLRAVAVVALGYLRAESQVHMLATFLNDETKPAWSRDKTLAELAEQALRTIGTQEAHMLLKRHKSSSAQTALGRLKQDTKEHPPVDLSRDDTEARPQPDAVASTSSPSESTGANILPFDDTEDKLLQVLQQLSASNWADRDSAARALRAYAELWRGSQNLDHVYPLLPYLRSKDAYVRWAVVEALAWIRNRAVVNYLLPLLHDAQWTVRVAVVEALAQIGDSLCVSYLLACLDDPHEKVREMLVVALSTFRDEEGVLDGLVACLHDKSELVVLTAVESLGKLSDRRAVAALLPLTQHEDVVLRWAVVEALGKLRDEASVPYLIALLSDNSVLPWDEDKSMTIAQLAAQTLRQMGSVVAEHALQQWENR